ncbi:Hypothetical protein NTJ_10273 [Nesidiocoris tenuis]|uniref:Uncharacterized protein n=1 Tax=Nesidiocoris tenuis TaxID=355587 RepID=A0ABN7B0Z6_9HEMI|nr:Hypothetical protein NTJ_10273 [Nesidiocoris tenuis]
MEVDGKNQGSDEPDGALPLPIVPGGSCSSSDLKDGSALMRTIPTECPAEVWRPDDCRPVKVWDTQIAKRRFTLNPRRMVKLKTYCLETFPKRTVKRLGGQGYPNFSNRMKTDRRIFLDTILEEAMQTLARAGTSTSGTTDVARPFRPFKIRDSERKMEEVEKLMWNLDLQKKNQSL